MRIDPEVERLVDAVMRHATMNRPRPSYDEEENVRGNLAAMGKLQLEGLVDLIERGESKEILPALIRQLYGHVLHEVGQVAA